MSTPRVAIVVALSRERRAIGNAGKLLWHISDDLKRFKALTKGHPVIMGRKTFESILGYLGKPLPERINIVVTRNTEYRHEGVVVMRTLDEAIAYARSLDSEEIHIGGGSDIYTQALPHVTRLYLTLVDDEPEADTFFPPYDGFTTIISEEKHLDHNPPYTWLTLERPVS
jgi:dihydrofolate reductase